MGLTVTVYIERLAIQQSIKMNILYREIQYSEVYNNMMMTIDTPIRLKVAYIPTSVGALFPVRRVNSFNAY